MYWPQGSRGFTCSGKSGTNSPRAGTLGKNAYFGWSKIPSMKNHFFVIPMILLMMACNERSEESPGLTLLVGTYTSGGSEGIYSMEFNTSTGELSAPKLIAKLPNPSFLAQSEDGKHLYAVQETDDYDARGGGVSAFGFKEGKWELLNSRGTQGAHPRSEE